MKVICIEDGGLPSDLVCPDSDSDSDFKPKKGEIYHVEDSFIDDGYCWYILKEDTWRDEYGDKWGYESQRFTSLTETESAVAESVAIIELTPHEQPKKWYQKIFSKL